MQIGQEKEKKHYAKTLKKIHKNQNMICWKHI